MSRFIKCENYATQRPICIFVEQIACVCDYATGIVEVFLVGGAHFKIVDTYDGFLTKIKALTMQYSSPEK